MRMFNQMNTSKKQLLRDEERGIKDESRDPVVNDRLPGKRIIILVGVIISLSAGIVILSSHHGNIRIYIYHSEATRQDNTTWIEKLELNQELLMIGNEEGINELLEIVKILETDDRVISSTSQGLDLQKLQEVKEAVGLDDESLVLWGSGILALENNDETSSPLTEDQRNVDDSGTSDLPNSVTEESGAGKEGQSEPRCYYIVVPSQKINSAVKICEESSVEQG